MSPRLSVQVLSSGAIVLGTPGRRVRSLRELEDHLGRASDLTSGEYRLLGQVAVLMAATAEGTIRTEPEHLRKTLDAYYFRAPGEREAQELDQGINEAVFRISRFPSPERRSIEAYTSEHVRLVS